jgi:hypothetical protein
LYEDEIKVVADGLAAVRKELSSQAGDARKRIVYPERDIERAVELFHRVGLAPPAFARQLGVSLSALTRWLEKPANVSAFLPVQALVEPVGPGPSGQTQATLATPLSATQPQLPTTTVTIRERVWSFPASLDMTRLRELMAALQGGSSC